MILETQKKSTGQLRCLGRSLGDLVPQHYKIAFGTVAELN